MWDYDGRRKQEQDMETVRAQYAKCVRTQLARMKIKDRRVKVVVQFQFRYHERGISDRLEWEGRLSDALSYEQCLLWKRLIKADYVPSTVGHGTTVYEGETHLGYLDSIGFRFVNPPSVREALGWILVANIQTTSCRFDMDSAVARLCDVVRQGTTPDVFQHAWQDALDVVFTFRDGMMTRDGYRASECYLWRAATKEVLGEVHEGFPKLIRKPIQVSLIHVM